MRIFIDATQPECELRIFAMSLVERHLAVFALVENAIPTLEKAENGLGSGRELLRIVEQHTRPSDIEIALPADAPLPSYLPRDLLERLPVRFSRDPGSLRDRLQRAVEEARGEPVIALPGNAVADPRVFRSLAWWRGGNVAFLAGEGEEASAALFLDAPLGEDGESGPELRDIALSEIERGRMKALGSSDLDSYIAKLRRVLPPYLMRVHDDASRERIERFLFQSNYKGSTDFLTKWVYPPIVWTLLKPLTRARVHPNTVTTVGILCAFLSVPLCAMGWWLPGLALAFAMSVLDSVDGKLARVQFKSSAQGDVLDHGLDIVHPPFWYWGWAWGLSGGDPYSPVFQASLWLAGFYILDRVMETLFKAATGKSIHGYTKLDERMRTVISRRNVNLAVFAVALPFGLGVEAFYLIVGWQAFTLLFHLERVIQFWKPRRDRTVAR